MLYEEIQDLMNCTAKRLVPELELNFVYHRNQPLILISHIRVLGRIDGGTVVFDFKEIESKRNIPQKEFFEFFLDRCIHAQKEIIKQYQQVLEKLEQQRDNL